MNAGLVKGRKVASWPSLREDLENAVAVWQDAEVVEDGQFITPCRPSDIPAFGRAIIRALSKSVTIRGRPAHWMDRGGQMATILGVLRFRSIEAIRRTMFIRRIRKLQAARRRGPARS